MPLKFRFALLTAALMLVLSVNALANSGEGAPEAPALGAGTVRSRRATM